MEFLQKPHLPDRPVKGVVIDCRADRETIESLKTLGIEPILSYCSENLNPAICSHPDMTIVHLGENRFICAPDAYDYYASVLPEAEVIKGEVDINPEYPHDVAYNITLLGDFAFMNTATEQIKVINNGKIINIRQGYTKCSICVVSEHAIITADTGIARAAQDNNIDVLQISPGNIELPGMNYGFIGGAAGLIAPDTLAVNGDITTHPDCNAIMRFCSERCVKIISLKSGKIRDIGSILPIY